MTETPDRVGEIYTAIDTFQRTHRLPGLQHAQIRGLLAEHLARVLPAAVAVRVPDTDRTPSRRAGLRDEIVKALGRIKTIPPVAHRREQADHVLAVLYREWPWLRAEAEDAAPATSHTVREQLLDALDFSYCLGLGFETPEMLLAAYDASRTVPPTAADRAAVLREAADVVAADTEHIRYGSATDYAERHADLLRRMAAVPAAVSGRTDGETGEEARNREPDPDCERCEGSGLDPDAYFVNHDTQTWTHAPCSECFPEEDESPASTDERVKHSGPNTKFCVLCLSGEHERVADAPAVGGAHSCRNCEGIDPDTCLMNPDRPKPVPVHAVPLPGSNGISSCCGRPPCEFVGERVTRNPDEVTCPAASAVGGAQPKEA